MVACANMKPKPPIDAEAGITCSERFPISGTRVCWGNTDAIHRRYWGARGFAHSDEGEVIDRDTHTPNAFWDEPSQTIYAQDTECGAKAAAVHERGHEEFIEEPSKKDAYSWKTKGGIVCPRQN